MDKLAEASRAGVEVQLIIRGICCILPGVAGETENVHVTSVVGRFLEHARIYQFGRGADLMTRNLNRRVEIACPIQDEELRAELRWILDAQLRDSAKASLVLPDGSYCRKHSAEPFDSQDYFLHTSMHKPTEAVAEPIHLAERLRGLLDKFRH